MLKIVDVLIALLLARLLSRGLAAGCQSTSTVTGKYAWTLLYQFDLTNTNGIDAYYEYTFRESYSKSKFISELSTLEKQSSVNSNFGTSGSVYGFDVKGDIDAKVASAYYSKFEGRSQIDESRFYEEKKKVHVVGKRGDIIKVYSATFSGPGVRVEGSSIYVGSKTPQDVTVNIEVSVTPPEVALPSGNQQLSVVVNNGHWGDWTHSKQCPDDEFVCGMDLLVEDVQGKGDDTSANGLALVCCKAKLSKGELIGQRTSRVVVDEMHWSGSKWRGEQRCPDNSGVCGLRTRLEKPQGGGDDTALNGVEMKCCTIGEERRSQTQSSTVMVDGGYWGDWDTATTYCDNDYPIMCGAQLKMEGSQGGKVDDTSLNGIKMICCGTKAVSSCKL